MSVAPNVFKAKPARHDGLFRSAVEPAAARNSAPEWCEKILEASDQRMRPTHVLEQTNRCARTEHAPRLQECCLGMRNGAQGQPDDSLIECARAKRQHFGVRRHKENVTSGFTRPAMSTKEHGGVDVGRDDARIAAVVPEVQTRAGGDLEYTPSRRSNDRPTPLRDRRSIGGDHDEIVQPGKELHSP